MSDVTSPPEPDDDETEDEARAPAWDAVEVMRTQAAKTRQDRDAAIAELRESTSDEQILDEFGIDLKQIEE